MVLDGEDRVGSSQKGCSEVAGDDPRFYRAPLHSRRHGYEHIPAPWRRGASGVHFHSTAQNTKITIMSRPTHDPSIDTFRVEYLIGPCFVLGLIFNYGFSFTEVFWSFSIFLESVAILPQLFMLQRTGEAETITTHYLAALGIYRALYIPNWIYRYFTENGTVDPIAVTAGIVQTGLYLDFFYVYFTKVLKGQKFELPA
ncbi:hypothetical protein C0995_016593 [Termitomyces sp. Mi166|nr:hypothetical protein C0995_016593 [Termitomyces sp. Mi166\